MKTKKQMYIDISYLLILGATFGAVMVLGIFVAPVVFHTESLDYFFKPLDHYSAGIIMAEIFHRFTYWAYVTLIAITLFEVSLYKQGQRDMIAMTSALFAIVSIMMFNGVYTPRILALQAEGAMATQSEAFEHLHLASELDFKLLALALAVLFFRRVMLLRTIKKPL